MARKWYPNDRYWSNEASHHHGSQSEWGRQMHFYQFSREMERFWEGIHNLAARTNDKS